MDCPDGFKCAPYATDGGVAWDANKCVPVAGNDTPGEGCTVEGSGTSGYDSCVAGALCTNVDMNNTGICVALCRGTMESPACSPGLACLSTNGAVLNLCVQACDPLAQNCMLDGQACIPDDGEFLCVDDASGGVQMDGTPCLYINECGPGLFCGVKELAPVVCADVGDADCCLSFCDLSDDACPGTTVCAAYFEPPSPDYPQVGYCADPD